MLNKINVSPQKQNLIVYVFLTVVTLAVFWQMTGYNFINFDDDVYVTMNSHVQSGMTLNGIRWAFCSTDAEFWHPLTWLSLMLDNQLYGLNAGGYHLTNLILHILNTLLLFWLFNRMTGSIWKSAFVAALFALHPLHVESVAWIAKRKDVLSAFFWMVTLCLYVYYTEKPVIRRYLLVLFSFILALMSKPMVVTLPIIMILLDYWPLRRFESKRENWFFWQLKEKIPFFILSVVCSIITFYVHNNPSEKGIPLSSRITNAPVSFVTYLEKTFWPHDLAVFYPFPDQIPFWQILGATLLIIIVSIAVIVMVKRFPYLFVGWLWYAITLLPVIGIIQVNAQAMSDHYTYLPIIGIAIMLAWGIPLLFPREDIRKKILFPGAIAALAILSILTWQQGHYWKNSIELFSHALLVTKDKVLVYNNRGIAYAQIGQYQPAIEDFTQAIRLKPNDAKSYSNRGITYAQIGQYQQAIEDFTQAIRLKPYYAEAYSSRGTVYAQAGQYQSAIEDFNQAIRLKPYYAEAYYNRGIAYAKLGRHQRAIEDYNCAIRMKPNDAEAYNNRGIAYFMQSNNELGCRDAQKVCAWGNCRLLELAKGQGRCR